MKQYMSNSEMHKEYMEKNAYKKDYNCWSKGEMKAMTKIFSEYHYDNFMDNPEFLEDAIPKKEKSKFLKWMVKRNGNRYKYLLVTINFKDNLLLNDIIKKVIKITTKKWIKKYMYCYEQRNENFVKTMDGIHVHMKIWLAEKKNPYHCKREIYNTVKNLVGNKLHVNVRYSNRDGCFEDYIKGTKNKEIKKNFRADVEWRKWLGLDQLYAN